MFEQFLAFFTRFDLELLLSRLLSLLDFSTYTVFTWIALALSVIGIVLSLFLWCNRDARERVNLAGALSLFFTVVNGPLLTLAFSGLLYENTALTLVPFVLWIIMYFAVIRDWEYIGGFLLAGIGISFVSTFLFGFFVPGGTFDEEMRLILSQTHTFSGFLLPYVILFFDIIENGFYPKKARRRGRKMSRFAKAHFAKKRTASSKTAQKRKPASSTRTSSPYSSSSSYKSSYKDVNQSREELQNKFIYGRLSLTEKERLAKEHNDKYFDAVRVDENGLYQNVYGHPDDFKEDLSQD